MGFTICNLSATECRHQPSRGAASFCTVWHPCMEDALARARNDDDAHHSSRGELHFHLGTRMHLILPPAPKIQQPQSVHSAPNYRLERLPHLIEPSLRDFGGCSSKNPPLDLVEMQTELGGAQVDAINRSERGRGRPCVGAAKEEIRKSHLRGWLDG